MKRVGHGYYHHVGPTRRLYASEWWYVIDGVGVFCERKTALYWHYVDETTRYFVPLEREHTIDSIPDCLRAGSAWTKEPPHIGLLCAQERGTLGYPLLQLRILWPSGALCSIMGCRLQKKQ